VKTTFCFIACYVVTRSRSRRFSSISLFIIINPFFSSLSFFQQRIASRVKRCTRTLSSQFQDSRITIRSIFKRDAQHSAFFCGKDRTRGGKYFFSTKLYTIIFSTSPLQYPVGVYMKNYEKPTNLIIAYQIGFLL
jgi:hypothetical protein